jgi:hypothetical protein
LDVWGLFFWAFLGGIIVGIGKALGEWAGVGDLFGTVTVCIVVGGIWETVKEWKKKRKRQNGQKPKDVAVQTLSTDQTGGR